MAGRFRVVAGAVLCALLAVRVSAEIPDGGARDGGARAGAAPTACSVVVAGGSTASLAAALSAADTLPPSSSVCLLEPTDWPGGQLTSSGVSAIDFGGLNRDPRTMSATFKSLYDWAGDFPSRCWVSTRCYRAGHCAQQWVAQQLQQRRNLRVFLRTVVTASGRDSSTGAIAWVSAVQRAWKGGGALPSEWTPLLSQTLPDWYSPSESGMFRKTLLNFTGSVFLDATEFGDVLVTSGVPSVAQGIETPLESSNATLSTCGQATTITFFMRADNGTTPPPTPVVPSGSDDGIPYNMDNLSYQKIWAYRRALSQPHASQARINPGEITQQNLGNDLLSRYLFQSLEAARSSAAAGKWAGGIDLAALSAAEQRAYGWFWYYRNQTDSVDPTVAALLVMDYTNDTAGTPGNGLSKMPYLRDTRRSVGLGGFRLMYDQIDGYAPNGSRPVGAKWGYRFPDAVALGNYNADFHHLSRSVCVLPDYVNKSHSTLPYYIPFRALTNADAPNLLVAGKTMATTFLANEATRLHPSEWSSGVAAGAAASIMVREQWTTTSSFLDVAGAMDALQANITSPPLSQPIEWPQRNDDDADSEADGGKETTRAVVKVPPQVHYSRTLQVSDGTWLTCAGRPASGSGSAGVQRLVVARSTDGGQSWIDANGIVVELSGEDAGDDLGNCDLLEAGATLFAAYRHHSNCSAAAAQEKGNRDVRCGQHRIVLAASRDGGATWNGSWAVVDAEGRDNGVWEPKLIAVPAASVEDRAVCGAHPPSGDYVMHCFYAREEAPSGEPARQEQAIVARSSCDGGVTWGPLRVVSATPASRDGMPGVATLDDAGRSLVVVHEGFGGQDGGWGRFGVRSVRSDDGGVTWSDARDVYAPPNRTIYDAGAPAVVRSPVNGRVYASYMTNYPASRAAEGAVGESSWPNGAHVAISVSLSPARAGTSPQFPVASSLVVSPTPAYWPSVFSANGHVFVEYWDAAGAVLVADPLH